MAGELSTMQRQVLLDLVAAGKLSAEQEATVRTGLEAAGREAPPTVRRWLSEAAGYLGGALMFAGAALLVALSWDELSRAGRVAVLAGVAILLAGAAVAMAGGPRGLRALAAGPSTIRRRLVSVLLALSSGVAAFAAGVGVTEEHAGLAGGITGLAMAVGAFLLVPSLPVLAAAAVLSVVTGVAVGDDLLGATPPRIGGTVLVVGLGWGALGLSRVLANRVHRLAGTAAGGAIGLLGGQMMLGSEGTAGWAYLLTLLVAAGCLAAYAVERAIVLLALGVVGATLAVSEAVADWTDGAAGGAVAVLAAGAVLLAGSAAALRLHRHQHR